MADSLHFLRLQKASLWQSSGRVWLARLEKNIPVRGRARVSCITATQARSLCRVAASPLNILHAHVCSPLFSEFFYVDGKWV